MKLYDDLLLTYKTDADRLKALIRKEMKDKPEYFEQRIKAAYDVSQDAAFLGALGIHLTQAMLIQLGLYSFLEILKELDNDQT